jgi:exodeoxyribonuclease VII large subunit
MSAELCLFCSDAMQPLEEKRVLTVYEITSRIKLALESSFPQVWIQGEISNAKLHSSGHFYFTLKDEHAQISAVMWRSRVANLLFTPEDGMNVIARGSITVYPPRGNYQIDVIQLQPLGVGELQLAFERLKKKLEAEGLFDPNHKKPLPEFPERIGIVTSETGAALQDIRSVLARRFPSLDVIVYPVRVQGAGAADEIAEAIREFNRYGEIDVMIVGRGGGSLEDLWAFNEEVVARAIYASKIPIISAVGHEIDFSIADFVADVRAATPSAAAELVVRDRTELLDILRNMCYTMRQAVENQIDGFRDRIRSLLGSYSFNRPRDLLRQFAQRVDELERSLLLRMTHLHERLVSRHRAAELRLEALNPARVLERGYAIVWKDHEAVTSARRLQEGDRAKIQFHDGTIPARVEKP